MTNNYYVLTYERVSTEDQKNTKSCDDQKSLNDRFIAQKGWKLASNGDYRDKGISGTTTNRPGLQDMLIRCQEDERIKAIVISESDRIARGNLTYLFIREALKKSGVKIVAVTQPMIDESAEGEMIGEIMGAVNGFLAEITKRKSMRALDEKANRGWWPGKASLGYKNVNIGSEEKPDRIITIDEDKKAYIIQIPTLYNQGLSYQEISDKLYEQGLRGNEEGKVSPEEIRKIIFSDFYLGEYTWRGVKHTGNHAPLFSWFEIQKARTRSQEKSHSKSTKALREKFLFKRLPFRCATCNCSITAESKTKHYKRTHRAVEYVFYHCTKSKGRAVCNQPYINRDDLITEFVEKVVKPIDIDEELAQFLLEEIDKDFTHNKENQDKLLTSIHIRLGQVDTALRNLFEMRMTGKLTSLGNKTPEEVFEEYKLKHEIERQKLVEAERKLEDGNKDWRQRASNFFLLCCDATNKFLKADEDKQYLFLRAVSSDLFLDNKNLVVTHQFPFSELTKLARHPGVLRDKDSNLGP
ncbi:MAG: recombinase family protein [Candidatus Levyibacteriota bacterium]